MAKKDAGKNRKARFEIENTMTAASVAGYLEGLAKGLREGAIMLGEDGESFDVSVSDDIEFELDAKHGKKKSRIAINLAFRAVAPDSASEPAEQLDDAAATTIPDEMSF